MLQKSRPEETTNAQTINRFKHHMEKLGCNEEIIYDYRATIPVAPFTNMD